MRWLISAEFNTSVTVVCIKSLRLLLAGWLDLETMDLKLHQK